MMQSPEWVRVCGLSDIPMLGSRVVRREHGADVAIFRCADDDVFALLDRCPHKGGALSQGIVFGRSVACPLHNWNIALDCGEAAAPDVGCTPAFVVSVQDGAVFLDASQLATLGIDAPPPAWPKLVRLSV
jgi:nitrite reductase (NADH) small subunit